MPLDSGGMEEQHERSGSPEDGSVEPRGLGEPLGTLICISLNHLLTH